MKNISGRNIGGFTLIELLVVVLIIGILSAVALPQYQKAVVKSRFAEAFTNLKTIAQADAACQLEKGSACGIDELSIEIPGVFRNNGYPEIETDYFIYRASENQSSSEQVQALYKKEDVCVCCMLQTGELTLLQDDTCREQEASFDYNKLLNIEQIDSAGRLCTCC